jgi:hypothetical protein
VALVRCWPVLPPAIRRAILALVGSVQVEQFKEPTS